MPDNDAPLLLDATRLIWRRWEAVRPTGIDRLCLAWLDHYAARAQAVLVYRQGQRILPHSTSRALFRLLAEDADDVSAEGRARFRRRLLALAVRHAWRLRRSLPGRGRPWLNVGHTGLDFPGLAGWARSAGVRPVLLVHDLIPLTHPEHCRAGEAARHMARMRTTLDIAARIITNSQHTLDVLAGFARDEGRPLPPALVAWPGTPRLPVVAASAPADADFIVLGTIEGRKNHRLLLDVWERLVAQHGAAAPRLIIIGRRGWACDDVLARLDAGGFAGRVVETGAIEDAGIAAHLAGARALLFPSLAEGYGLPLVEALAAGVPVIASDLPVFREIGQGVPDLLPADDAAGWAAAIMAYAAPDSPARAAQMQRLAGFHAPDWAGHFALVDGFLETLQPCEDGTGSTPVMRP